MPKKIRELKAMLRKAGFRWRPGKGSHTIWEHPLASKEDEVAERIAEVERTRWP
jgi:predicted RNA binding protein YcfA (HicA-like mRNA interferase family)